jgi:hypothetical protein
MDPKESFKENLKKQREGLGVSSNPLSLFEKLSEEYDVEIESNKILKFKKNLSDTTKEIKEKSLDHKIDFFKEGLSQLNQIFEENRQSISDQDIIEPIQKDIENLEEDPTSKYKKNLSETFKNVKNKSLGQNTNIFDSDSLIESLSQIKEEDNIAEVKREEVLNFFSTLAEKQNYQNKDLTETLDIEHLEVHISDEDPKLEIEEPVSKEDYSPKDLISATVQSISKEEALKPQDNLPENYTNLFSNPDSPKADPTIKALQNKMKFLEDWIAKISMAGPGGGEVNFRYLDDVDPNSIGENKYLTYNQDNRKFYFDYVTSNNISNNTRVVTSSTYSLVPDDYYVGINYAGPTTITLQPTAQNGKVVVIKDESGNCSINPITVTGNVDNDSGGFILKINNGAIQMIYRNGWRII